MDAKDNTQYAVSFYAKTPKSQTVIVVIYYTDGTYQSIGSPTLTDPDTYTYVAGVTTSGKTIDYIKFGGSGGLSVGAMIKNLQIQEGTIVTDFEPYGKYKIPVKVSGKNLINVEDATREGIGATNPFDLLYPNTEAGTYTFSADVKVENYQGSNAMIAYGYKEEGDTNNTYGNFVLYSDYTGEGRYSFSFTTSKKLTFFYIFISAYCKGGTITVKNAMLALNNADITYEPYHEPIVTNIYLNQPLRKTNDVVDSIDFSSRTISSQINEITFDGSDDEVWSLNTALTGVNRFALTIADSEKSNNNRVDNQCKCNYFDTTKSMYYGNSNYVKNLVYIYSGVVYFYTDPTQFPDIATWKNWLKENNVILQYKTSNVNEIPINMPELLTFEDYTKIEVLTEVSPSKIEGTYYGYTME